MAKQKPLGDWQDTVPEEVSDAAEAYDKAHGAKAKALGKLNTARENVIAAMKKHGVKKVPIRGGDKFLVHAEADQVKIEKPKKTTPDSTDDESDETLFDKD